MIEAALALARLLAGLAAVEFIGYGLLMGLLPRPESSPPRERLALGFGVGALLVTLWMLALTGLGLSFSLPLILGPLLMVSALPAIWAVRRSGISPFLPRFRLELKGWDWAFALLLAVLLALTFSRALVIPMSPDWSWDAISTWGLKAKAFYLGRAVDLSRIDAHNYYPNLVPLLLTYLYFCLGEVNDFLVNGLFPLWGGLLLVLLYSLLTRLGLSRRTALGTTAFFALNGAIFTIHLTMAYSDLALAYYTLMTAGLLYLCLRDLAPSGFLPLIALGAAGMAWTKFEGPPLAATIILAAILTLAWLRPPGVWRRLLNLAWPAVGAALGYLPWHLYCLKYQIPVGEDHILNFYPYQFFKAISYLAVGLFHPHYFGLLWPALILALLILGRRLWGSPSLYLVLFAGGNLLAILLAYALAPTSSAEFPQYIWATLDRLLLHITPVTALLIGEGVKELGEGPGGT